MFAVARGSSVSVPDTPLTVLVKLGSIARHAEEFLSSGGAPEDAAAIKALLADPEIREWMAQADAMNDIPPDPPSPVKDEPTAGNPS